ncbi:hypothetical protein [Nocardioides iriomotensis]|uniref:Peptidase MA-like domain-containing protein n=1 Tax=Nocardioides iriomotensis TaxID=715784 RepID=A0A4Q5IXC4_9ACTN|nr:hypothetical protein [Nocardioides iriomotensis]RYU09611.1 hypothetical protein ETU37_21510 [Nocardioides iriomotensis]
MQSDLAEPTSTPAPRRRRKAGRSRRWATGLVLCVLAAAVSYWVLSRPETAVLPRPGDSAAPRTREDAAAGLLADLTTALETGSRADVEALAAPGDRDAVRELAALQGNVQRLGVRDLEMRYVDENAGRTVAGVAPPLRKRAWVGDVALSWGLDGFDGGDSRMEVTMTFAGTEDGAAFVTARGDYGRAAPLWMLERLAVRRSSQALVMVAAGATGAGPGGRGVASYHALADRAVVDVRKVFPRWQGPLVVEVPSSQDELARALGSEQTAYSSIAAVTTPVDGSSGADSPIHIFVNPPVFGPLGEQGAQIVMSHEAAHVATKAAASSMPTWLLEGFADYVALAHVDLPVEVTASQIIAQVQDQGAPPTLPGASEFETENTTLGASYESAWLACRLLAEQYGEKKLLAFYERADQDGSTKAAFRDVLGTDERAFTESWRDYLEGLAGV